jgi:hypothetical protein
VCTKRWKHGVEKFRSASRNESCSFITKGQCGVVTSDHRRPKSYCLFRTFTNSQIWAGSHSHNFTKIRHLSAPTIYFETIHSVIHFIINFVYRSPHSYGKFSHCEALRRKTSLTSAEPWDVLNLKPTDLACISL